VNAATLALKERGRALLPSPCGCGSIKPERVLVGNIFILRCASCGGTTTTEPGAEVTIRRTLKVVGGIEQLGTYNQVPDGVEQGRRR
jgi:hypothetical protein